MYGLRLVSNQQLIPLEVKMELGKKRRACQNLARELDILRQQKREIEQRVKRIDNFYEFEITEVTGPWPNWSTHPDWSARVFCLPVSPEGKEEFLLFEGGQTAENLRHLAQGI
jgi:hypothetical protein